MMQRNESEDRSERIEGKLDDLARMVDQRFEQVDQRFEQVDQRFEQVDQRFEQVDQRFEQVDQRFEQVDQRFEQVDHRFEQVTEALVEQRQYTEFAFERLDTRLSAVERQISAQLIPMVGRIERKLDGFIEVQTKTNELVERRLRRLESAAEEA